MDLFQDLPPGGTIASPCRISPFSTVSESCCPWYGCNAFGISLISSGYPVMIISARALSSGSFWFVSLVFFSALM